MSECPKFFGKYRGKVEDNFDPMQLGRVRVMVPAVLGEGTMSWAMPCVPYAGSGVGFFAIPPNGANIWEMKVLKTSTGSITINDLPVVGGISIETTSGMKMAITSLGIEIDNGKGGSIKLTGPKVSVNGGALEVV